jgi:hypothetical protein
MKSTLGMIGIFAFWFFLQWLGDILAPYAEPIGIGILVLIVIGCWKALGVIFK